MNYIDEIYVVVSIFIVSAVLLCFGLCFLFLVTPDKPTLHNYRTAKRAMAYSYLFFGLINVMEYCFRTFPVEPDYIRLYRTVTLVIACSQSFLFTYTLITLIRANFFTAGKIRRELTIVVTFVAVNFVVFFTCSGEWFTRYFYGAVILYIVLLVRYTRLFVRNYHIYLGEMNNFFSGEESKRLRWINRSFYAALAIGVMALFPALFSTLHLETYLAVILFVFYTYFAIRFINYAILFDRIEEVVAETCETCEVCDSEVCDVEESKPATLSFSPEFEEKINKWIEQKQFLRIDISIRDVAEQLNTTRRYLSEYINKSKQKNFSEWINGMRIDEAKNLLSQNPKLTVAEISLMAGFNNNSYFGQLFLKSTGYSPQKWREKTTE
ncbi:MAG: helix-turn-helix domain-containing protein [Prevotellaceae bacterium]|jgi:AraC-like DNA-binding protein|nr:helix-turn-helix domain-containing protein [Prevotellaceae bacterium]